MSATLDADRRLGRLVTLETALAATYDDAVRWYGQAISRPEAAQARTFGDTGAFVHAAGAVLTDDRGEQYLDCLAGFGAVNLGHNHPELIAAMEQVVGRPEYVQVWPSPLMPALALSLTRIAPGDLERVFLCNSGTEAVEAAIKLVRAGSDRSGLLSNHGAFHGKTMGSLSVSGREVYRRPFDPLVPGCDRVPFGDLDALEQALRTRAYGGFFVEPVQGEAGVVVPPDGYLKDAEKLCRATGTLFVVDEVQTGIGRTGTMFACDLEGVSPDVLCLAKGLGGGLVPIGACLARPEVWDRAYGTRATASLHSSTFAGGTRVCAVALKTLEVVLRDRLPERADAVGSRLLERLSDIAARHSLVEEVRGRGLLIGLELASPRVGAALAREYGGAVTAALLWQEHRIVTINTLNNPKVLRIEPPLVITDEQADRVADAVEAVARGNRGVLGATLRVGTRSLRRRPR